MEQVFTRLGAHGSSAAAYLGFTFLTVAWLVAFVAAGQITTARAEEAEGRLDHLLAGPVARSSWLLGRVALATLIVVLAGLLAGLFAWGGAASQDSGVGLVNLLAAGVSMVPPALCILGVGVLALGVWPQAAAVVTYGVLTWALLIELAGGFFSSSHWLLDTSVFHHVATAPAVSPDWTSAAALLAIGAVTAAAGVLAFARRDLASE